MTGYISGKPLQRLFAHAGFFVMPSYHEGHPIALLEALSYGLPALVSEYSTNIETDSEGIQYFNCGDVGGLNAKMGKLTLASSTQAQWNRVIERV